MKKIFEAQKYLKEIGADGWLLYDFHRNNPLAHKFLEIPSTQFVSRRFFYWIPVLGEPVKVVHAIEPYILDKCPGTKKIFDSWQSLEAVLKEILRGMKRVAMEYSPNNAIPYVSRVDAGTVEFIRSLGIEVVSSAEILPHFTAVLDLKQAESHFRAAKGVDETAQETWKWLGEQLKRNVVLTEYEVQQKVLELFEKRQIVTQDPLIVAVNDHSADPHYETKKEGSSQIRPGDFILLDIWGKEKWEGAIWGDITRVAVAASQPTIKQKKIFQIVRNAQRAATDLVRERFAHKRRIEGWEVDDAARKVIRDAGYEKYFIHRTGHNIETDLHGSGANMDNLELHDVRQILPGTCFSIEPGIYLPGEFGVRLEYDLYVHPDGKVEITGGEQNEIVTLVEA